MTRILMFPAPTPPAVPPRRHERDQRGHHLRASAQQLFTSMTEQSLTQLIANAKHGLGDDVTRLLVVRASKHAGL